MLAKVTKKARLLGGPSKVYQWGLVRKRIAELRIRDEGMVSQREQESLQGVFFNLRHVHVQSFSVSTLQVVIQGGVILNASAVVVQYLIQSLETAIVHVRTGQLNVAQGRNAELAVHSPGITSGDVQTDIGGTR